MVDFAKHLKRKKEMAEATVEKAPEPEMEMGNVSMMDIAGLSVDEIAEVRASKIPGGLYEFEIGKQELLDTEGMDDDGLDVKQLTAAFALGIKGVKILTLPKETPNPAELIDKVFTHRIKKNLSMRPDGTLLPGKTNADVEAEIIKFIGMVKGFLVDCGCNGTGTLQEMCAGSVGTRFTAPIQLRKNKRDKDADPWPNLVTDKIKKAA